MNNFLPTAENYDSFVVIGIILFFGFLEFLAGHLKQTNRSQSDWIQEAGSFFVLSVLTKPAIVLIVILVGTTFFPQFGDLINHWNFTLALVLFLLVDDVLQYWYHRFAHEYEFLWKLHRPHHQAEEMGFFIAYRNAGLYYVLMPNIWWIGMFTFLGGAEEVALGLVLKQIVIISSHSTIQWDKSLYEKPFFRPLMSILERIIITPAFHYAHHGKSKRDGISDPNGNFGNMFSIWDQLFGTAFYSRKFPTELGLENDPKEPWTESFLYPIIKSKNEKSELSSGYIKEKTTTLAPITVELVKGTNYLWCQCGKSKNQPFCDGTHHGSKFKPLLFVAKRNGKVRLCNCKLTKTSPFCDDSHKGIEEKE